MNIPQQPTPAGPHRQAGPPVGPRLPRALIAPAVPFAVLSAYLSLMALGAITTGGQAIRFWTTGTAIVGLLMLTCVIWAAVLYLMWTRRMSAPTAAGVAAIPDQRQMRARPEGLASDRSVLQALQLILGAARSLSPARLAQIDAARAQAADTHAHRDARNTAVQALAHSDRRTLAQLHLILEQLAEISPAAHEMGLAAAVEDLVPGFVYTALVDPWASAQTPTAGASPDGVVRIGVLSRGELHAARVTTRNPGAGRTVEAFMAWLTLVQIATDDQLAHLEHMHVEGSDHPYRAGAAQAWTMALRYGRGQLVQLRALNLSPALWNVAVAILAQDLIPEPVYLRLTAGWTATGAAVPSPYLTVRSTPVGHIDPAGLVWCADHAPDDAGDVLHAYAVAEGSARPWCAHCARSVVAVTAAALRQPTAP